MFEKVLNTPLTPNLPYPTNLKKQLLTVDPKTSNSEKFRKLSENVHGRVHQNIYFFIFYFFINSYLR